MSDRPLLTLLVLAYNQESYIRAAVKGAFSQTYTPLEIILSDDCSPDRTFHIMQELAAAYRGPHTVILNCNKRNMGIGAHLNTIMRMARGELMVGAAGDDISLPERVEKIYRVYEESGGRAMSIYTAARIIDGQGLPNGFLRRPLEEGINDFQARLKSLPVRVSGCSHAWHRRVFDVFGDMLDETVAEDRVLPFRASLLGTIYYLDEPLVLYRQHGANISDLTKYGQSRRDLCKVAALKETSTLVTLRNNLRDLSVEHPAIQVDAALRDRVRAYIREQSALLELDRAFLTGGLLERVRVISRGFREGLPSRRIRKWLWGLVFPSLYARTIHR